MGTQNLLPSTDRQPSPQSTHRALHLASFSSMSITRRFIYKAFALLVISALAGVATAAERSGPDTTDSAKSQRSSSVRVQLNHQSSTDGATDAESAAPADSNAGAAQPDPSTLSDTASPDTTATNNSSVDVTVDGQSVAVPANGSTQQTIASDGATTTVNISNEQSATGRSFNAGFSTNSIRSRHTDSTSSVQIKSENSFP